MLLDPHSSQQHAGLQHAVRWLQQEVTMPKARLKPTLPGKSGVNGGPISCQHILVSCINWWHLLIIQIKKMLAGLTYLFANNSFWTFLVCDLPAVWPDAEIISRPNFTKVALKVAMEHFIWYSENSPRMFLKIWATFVRKSVTNNCQK